jgi:lipid II:glycine glycyltransferase (peptidoglycan interpeptide bridge formation enzyme)
MGVQSTPGGFPSESATNKEFRAAMFVCDFEGTPVSAIFVTLHNGIATYALGASSGRALKVSKTVLPMTEAILWARQAGAHTFDMGGIPMAGDHDSKRSSIAEFKHSYTRSEAHLVHEHVRWL